MAILDAVTAGNERAITICGIYEEPSEYSGGSSRVSKTCHESIVDRFAARGKACIVLADGTPACTLSGRYVALRREAAPNA